MLDGVVEALYYAVDNLYMKTYEELLGHWESSAAAFNHGQQTIYMSHLNPAVTDWLDGAQNDWPYADADYYVDALFSSYNSEVTERAFSDTIMAPVDDLWENIYHAQELYETAQFLEIVSFG